MKIHFKKLSVAAAFIIFITAGIAATNPPEEHAKNLKVLPKDISHEDLDKIMDEYKAALGVHCDFCHAHSKDSTSHHLDFASDEKPEKDIARNMMRMTAKINKKYFHFDKSDKDKGDKSLAVTCITCHHGNPQPENAGEMKK